MSTPPCSSLRPCVHGACWSALQVKRGSDAMPHYSPREVADKTGFSVDTLRYYEKIGFLASVAPSSGGQRVFTEDDVAWLGILQCLRETGMPIASMLRYAELARRGDDTIAERLGLLEAHDQVVEDRIAELRAKQVHIRRKVQWYRSHARARAA